MSTNTHVIGIGARLFLANKMEEGEGWRAKLPLRHIKMDYRSNEQSANTTLWENMSFKSCFVILALALLAHNALVSSAVSWYEYRIFFNLRWLYFFKTSDFCWSIVAVLWIFVSDRKPLHGWFFWRQRRKENHNGQANRTSNNNRPIEWVQISN